MRTRALCAPFSMPAIRKELKMITYNMHINGASVRLANNEIEWKKTKGKRKTGIIKSIKKDSYMYTHDFKNHYDNYIHYQNMKILEDIPTEG